MKRNALICFFAVYAIISIVAQPRPWVIHYDRNNGGLNENVYDLKQDSLGVIWITTYGGLYSYDGQRFVLHTDSVVKPPMAGYHWRPQTQLEQRFYDIAQKNKWLRDGKERIKCSLTDKDGNLWLGFSNGLRLCNEREYPFHFFDIDEEVLCLFQSNKGELWMTTREGHICLLDNSFTPIVYLSRTGEWSKSKINSGLVVMNICETPEGSLWLSARRDGILRLRQRGSNIMDGFNIQQIVDDGDKDGGLHALNNVYSICLDRDRRLWTASLKTGVGIIMNMNPQAPNDIINLNALLNRANRQELPERIRCFLPLFSNEWLVGSDNGLFYMKPSTWGKNEIGVFKQLLKNEADTTDCFSVQCMLCDHNGYIFVGTSGDGLIMLNKTKEISNPTEVRFLSKETGFLSSNVVYSLTEDKGHGVWGFCDNGIFRITSDKGNKSFYNLYSVIYGDEYSSSWPAMSIGNGLLLKDGRIIKGTRKGYLWFPADSITKIDSKHNIFVEAAYKLGERDSSFVPGDTIVLPCGTRDVSLYCSVLDYNRLSNVIYAYRVAEKDTIWTYTTNPVFELRNLPAGYSRLEIRATNGDGVWSGNEKNIILYVEPDDNWILFVVIVLGIVIGIAIYAFGKNHSTTKGNENIPNVLEPILDKLPTKDVLEEQFRVDIRKHIVEHIDDSQYGSDLLAKDMGISKNGLVSKVKDAFGVVPVELINRIRIQAATELLTQTELTVSEVAYRVGFNDPKYFSRVYKKMTGESPSDTRLKSQ